VSGDEGRKRRWLRAEGVPRSTIVSTIVVAVLLVLLVTAAILLLSLYF
jgi:hypothetical protein